MRKNITLLVAVSLFTVFVNAQLFKRDFLDGFEIGDKIVPNEYEKNLGVVPIVKDAWIAKSGVDCLTIIAPLYSQGSGTEVLSMVAKKNENSEDRFANVFFTDENNTKHKVAISQYSNSSSYLLGEKKYFYPQQGEEISSSVFSAGDTIVLKNGEWKDITLRLKGNGTEKNPIVFMAETPGKVLMKGGSSLVFDGSYIEVSGLLFTGSTTMIRNHVVFFSQTSSNCRFTNSAIVGYNPVDSSTWETRNTKYVSLYGKNHRVDHCYFEDKRNLGTLLIVSFDEGVVASHRIDHNHFYKRLSMIGKAGNTINGQDIIRIGGGTATGKSSCIVENNLFEECDGEVEIISNKSNDNIYRYNVFYKCSGTLTLRHGHNCQVYGNFFIGGGVPRSGGVRVMGENHIIYNNYFQDLTGARGRDAIAVYNGGNVDPQQVKNAQIFFNSFYNCENSIKVGHGLSALPVVNSKIMHNVIYSSNDFQIGVRSGHPNNDIEWKNNIINQGKLIDFTPSEDQFLKSNADFNLRASHPVYGIYKPTTQSLLANCFKTTDFSEVVKDICGVDRATVRTIGAFEISESVNILIPTAKNVGCSFMNK